MPEGAAPQHPDAVVIRSDAPDLTSTLERRIIDLRGSGPLLSIGHYRYLSARSALPEQVHPDVLVLALPWRSGVDALIDDQVVQVPPGTLLCIPPGTRYRIGVGSQPRGELLWLLARADRIDRPAVGSVEDAVAVLIAHGTDRLPAPRSAIDALLRAVGDEPRGSRFVAEWRRMLVASALLELADATMTAPDHPPAHPALRSVITWIDDHLHEPIPVARLVEVSGMSPTHFYDTFTEAFGCTPKDYVLLQKITRSKELLESGERVSAVAHALGFSTSQHFSTAFRRYVGASPTQWRAGGDG